MVDAAVQPAELSGGAGDTASTFLSTYQLLTACSVLRYVLE
jgi:hypothetical protein